MQNGADLQQAGGANPLAMAIVKQNVEIVNCLLQAGADPEVLIASGMTPLQLAAGAALYVYACICFC